MHVNRLASVSHQWPVVPGGPLKRTGRMLETVSFTIMPASDVRFSKKSVQLGEITKGFCTHIQGFVG